MWDIGKEIEKICMSSSVEFVWLDDEIKNNLLNQIGGKYLVSNLKFPLWERLISDTATRDDISWSDIDKFILNNEVVLFFNNRDERKMYKFTSGKDVVFVLSELFYIEFYLTDINTNYLICFNHHDILFGNGTAKLWVEEFTNKNQA